MVIFLGRQIIHKVNNSRPIKFPRFKKNHVRIRTFTTTSSSNLVPKDDKTENDPSSNSQNAAAAAAAAGVTALRTILDQHIVGHADTKECILLGLAANEHVFVQGEPGTAKTYAAELAAHAAGLQTFSVQFHRDTRLQDLIGDSIIVREQVMREQQHQQQHSSASRNSSSDNNRTPPHAEIVRQAIERGGLLTAQVAVLDDLTRAPGEALNVLLRILNERTFGDEPIPLKCAIATANAPRDDMYVEPLDPANLDRFALQVQSDGLIVNNDWTAVGQLIDMYPKWAQEDENNDAQQRLQKEIDMAQAAKAVADLNIHSVVIEPDMKECYIMFLQWLANHAAVTPRNSLLTDRTFLVKGPKILRAKAALEGRRHVQVQDMEALRHLTTFRVPAIVHEQVCELLKLLAETSSSSTASNNNNNNNDDDDNNNGGGMEKPKSDKNMVGYLRNVLQQFDEGGPRIGGPRGTGASSSSSKLHMQQEREDEENREEGESMSNNANNKQNEKRKDQPNKDSIDHDLLSDIGGTAVLHASISSFMTTSQDAIKEGAIKPLRRFWGSFQGPQIKLNLHGSAVSGAESVMAVLHGRTRRSRAHSRLQQAPCATVGQPRERGRLASMGDPNLFQDADPADISSWLTTPTSSLPRGLLRHPKKRGGSLALARDISDSMWGPRAALASATTQAAINLARQRGMRFGYCEFAGQPKFYHQRLPSHVVQSSHEHDNADGTRTSHFTNTLLEWGYEMTDQLGSLLGFERGKTETNLSGHFFGVDYTFCERRARQLETDGFTNLQEMLRQLLDKFRASGLPPHERHLLIITDGSPTMGSATCTDEAMLARSLGVAIHPIFVMDGGVGEQAAERCSEEDCYPQVLHYLAEETNGVRFLAKHEVSLDKRAEEEDNEYAHLVRVRVELAQ